MPFLRNTLQRRFLTLLIPVIVGGLVAMALVGHLLLRRTFERDVQTRLSAQLLSQVLPMTTRLHSLNEAFASFVSHDSGLPPARGHARPGIDPLYEDADAEFVHDTRVLLGQWNEIEEIVLVRDGEWGRELLHVGRSRIETEIVEPEAGPAWAWPERVSMPRIVDPVRGSHRVWLCSAPSAERGRPFLWLMRTMPTDRAVTVIAVLAQDLADPYLANADTRDGGFHALFDVAGRRLHPPSEDSIRADFGDFQSAASTHLGTQSWRAANGEDWILTTHRDAELGLLAFHAVPRQAVTAELKRMSQWATAVLVVVTLLSFALISLAVRRVARPLEGLVQTMERVAEGDLRGRLPVGGPDEMERLARAFNTMISDLHTTHAALRSQSDRLSAALADVENVEAMKDSFLALVSHEVRTPLTSIMGGVEFLRDEFADRHDETETEFMDIIYDSARRLSGFMNDAIMMAQLQSNRGQGGFEPFSLSALIETKLSEQRPLIESRKLRCENSVLKQNESIVVGDWTLLQVAIEKIFHNAVRHNVDGGELRVELVDHIIEDDAMSLDRLMTARGLSLPEESLRWTAVRVFNTGSVVPPEKVELLFERFELTHDIDNHQRGSGLSLPIAFYIIQYHGGTIEVRAVGELGMAFYVVLPARQGFSARRAVIEVPAGVDSMVATAHLVRVAEQEVAELEALIEESERMHPDTPSSEPPDGNVDLSSPEPKLEEVLVRDDPNA